MSTRDSLARNPYFPPWWFIKERMPFVLFGVAFGLAYWYIVELLKKAAN